MIFTRLVVFLGLCIWSIASHSADKSVTLKSYDVWKRKGTLKPQEVLKWSTSDKMENSILHLKNDYFTVNYPSCFSVEGLGAEDSDEIEKSPIVVCKRTSKCPQYESKNENANLLVISANQDGVSLSDRPLLIQKISVNGNEGTLQAGVFDSGKDENMSTTLRWEVAVICKGTRYTLLSALAPGEESLNRIEKNDYEVQQDFKKIISSFKCK